MNSSKYSTYSSNLYEKWEEVGRECGIYYGIRQKYSPPYASIDRQKRPNYTHPIQLSLLIFLRILLESMPERGQAEIEGNGWYTKY